MRVIINLDSAQKLLPYLKKSVDAVIVTKNISLDTSIEFDSRNFPVLPYRESAVKAPCFSCGDETPQKIF